MPDVAGQFGAVERFEVSASPVVNFDLDQVIEGSIAAEVLASRAVVYWVAAEYFAKL